VTAAPAFTRIRHLRKGTLKGEKRGGQWRIRGADALSWKKRNEPVEV